MTVNNKLFQVDTYMIVSCAVDRAWMFSLTLYYKNKENAGLIYVFLLSVFNSSITIVLYRENIFSFSYAYFLWGAFFKQ